MSLSYVATTKDYNGMAGSTLYEIYPTIITEGYDHSSYNESTGVTTYDYGEYLIDFSAHFNFTGQQGQTDIYKYSGDYIYTTTRYNHTDSTNYFTWTDAIVDLQITFDGFEYGPDGDKLLQGTLQYSYVGPEYNTSPILGVNHVLLSGDSNGGPGQQDYTFRPLIGLDSRFATEENIENYYPYYATIGSSTNDVWFGTASSERIKTLEGNDSVDAGAGNDTLQGGSGNDTLNGGDGSDVLWGYEDNDLLNGGAGIDDLFGNKGNDTLDGGLGADNLAGGDGSDVLYSRAGEGPDTLDGGNGLDRAEIDRSNSTVPANINFGSASTASGVMLADGTVLKNVEEVSFKAGAAGDSLTAYIDLYETYVRASFDGGSGNDTLQGGAAADVLSGGEGNDVLGSGTDLFFFLGGDTLLGGSGNDTISAVLGKDVLLDGGAGADILRTTSFDGPIIADFSTGGEQVVQGTKVIGFETYDISGREGHDRITFGSGNDTYTVGQSYPSGDNVGGNVVYGGAGNDTFVNFARGPSNYFDGGEGNDTINAVGPYDTLRGGNGDDQFNVTLSFDSEDRGSSDEAGVYHGLFPLLDGGTGNDKLVLSAPTSPSDPLFTLAVSADFSLASTRIDSGHYGLDLSGFEAFEFTGGVGDDSVRGGLQADVLLGSGGKDILFGGSGDDTLDGGADDDRLEGQLGNDLLIGGDGNDFLTGLEGSDTMQGGAGNDQLYSFVGQGPDMIDGGADTDYALISRTNLTTNLTLDLSLAGTQDLGDGTLITSIEQLTYRGGLGVDRVSGGALADDLSGNAGNDSLSGQGGNDTLDGGAGVDTLLGGAGDDTIVARGGEALSDLIDAGTGTDTLKVDGAVDLILSSFNALTSSIEVWAGNNKSLVGTGGANRFDLSGLTSVVGLLAVDAGVGNDTVIGSSSADNLLGGAGTDSLSGGAGDDTLTGGAGNDTLDGGTGSDTIVFSGLKSEYSVKNRTGGGYMVTDLRTGSPDGTDVVLNAEVLRFSDTTQTLTAVNSAPGAISDSNAAANQVAENAASGTLVGVTALASDPDAGDSLTYLLVNNAGGRFAINVSTGVVTVANGSLLDYETATGHLIRVRATDTGGLFSEADFTVNLTDVAEGGTSFTGTAGADTFIATSVANWTLSGLDGNDSLTGAGGNDTLDGGLGNDTLTGGVGNDTFLVRGTEASADSLLGGEGTTDTLKVEGTTILTLAGFDTLVNGIEVWAGNNKGVIGTGAANRFDLSGLTSITGLPSLDAGGGNDTVIGSGSADNLLGGAGTDSLVGGAGSDTLTGGAGNDTLDGGAGSDTIVFSGLLSNYSVANRTGGGYLVQDLRTGSPDGTDTVLNAEVLRFSDASVALAASNSAPSDIALSGTQVSENAAAGTLIGTLMGTDPDAGDKLTFALAAPSNLFSVSGTSLVVASGAVLDYEAAQSQNVLIKVTDAAGVSYTESFGISLTNQFVTTMGTSAADVLTAPTPGEEARISGLDGNDTLTGAAGNDTLDGGNGADSLVGGAGADQIIGGAGSDTAGYESASFGIGLDMADAAWAGAYGDARGDVLTGIERVNGSAYADVIRGTSAADVLGGNAGNDLLLGRDGADTLTGGDGNDTIEGGAGADNLNGQAGTDLISYASATGAITLDLANLASRTGEAALDTIQAGFEGIIGTAFADTLSGTTGSNVLEGGAGNDLLSGRAGADTFVFRSGSGSDRITDFTAGTGVNDVIEWHGQFTSFAGVQAAASDYTGTVQGSAFMGVQIQAGTDVLYLAGVTKAALVADDFAYL